MQKKKPKPAGTGGLYLPLNQKLQGQVPKHARQSISTLLAILRGADTPKPDDNKMPKIHHLDKTIEVVRIESERLISDLEAIKAELQRNPPIVKAVGRPKGAVKKKIEKD